MKKIAIMTDDKIIREKVVSAVTKMGDECVITGISSNISSAVLDIMKNKPDCVVFAIKDFNKAMKFFDAQTMIIIRTDRMEDQNLIKGERISEHDIGHRLEKYIRENVKEKKIEKKIESVIAESAFCKKELTGGKKESESEERIRKSKKIDLVVIGVSTGGPYALKEVIPFIKADLQIPVVIIQHMPAGFTKDLAKGLGMSTKLSVLEAGDEELKKGNIYIMPGGKNTGIIQNGNNLKFKSNTEKYGFYTPSVDYMLESIANIRTINPLVVIMTGMGNDGTQGVKRIKQEGRGFFVTQSRTSCVVYGMPRVVDESGCSDLSNVDVKDIANEINKRV